MDMISRRALRHAAILCCFTTLFGACARPTPSHASVQVTKRDSSGVVLVELSISPTAMARGLTDVDTLRPDLDIAPSGESARGYISDVIGRTDGSIITLDREVDSVRVYTATGRRTQAWAVRIDSLHRRASPLAIVGLGSEVAVLNPHRRGALLAYSADGQLAAEYVGSTYADWESLLARGPFVYYAINVAEGPEDYTRRIGALSDSTFVVEERPADAAARQTDAVLVVHDKRLRTRDTVATLPLAPVRRAQAVVIGDTNRFERPMFAPTTLWATSDGHLALSGTDSSSIRIFDVSTNRLRAVVRWPVDSIIVTPDDREAVAKWIGRVTLLRDPIARRAATRFSKSEIQQQYRAFSRRLSIADRAPSISAVWLAGRCLWMSGWLPDDAVDATSLTLIAIDYEQGVLVQRVRLAGWSRIRQITTSAIYSTHLDSLGISHAERYTLDSASCTTTNSRTQSHS